jgi:hypothetical protein
MCMLIEYHRRAMTGTVKFSFVVADLSSLCSSCFAKFLLICCNAANSQILGGVVHMLPQGHP